ncbi:YeeE/YedE thiosulfate transporter family protein [uncultured Paracoccus sp.]|uniref:YeeE/YedE thiosulfate transporter family protein n=1 Tax=uncultured Paracoccus sp. TaxID=189685 RepID=UPI0026044D57|nr:YeeE/YedE thiosulfate transporter family protein [uncultured Paracoccus sp.]
MLFEITDTIGAPATAVLMGLALGAAFGILAERSAFCFRRSLVGEDRAQAAGVWLAALAAAIGLTQAAGAFGLVSFADHRLLAPDVPFAAVVIGGLLFGAGMVLARGCISRLTVLAATGNLRAAITVLSVALIAHATMKGVLSPLREVAGSVTVALGPYVSLAALPGGAALWTVLLCGGLGLIVLRSGARPSRIAMGVLIGALVPLAWLGTSYLAADPFEPVAAQTLSFTAPFADTLFWIVAASSIPAGFGVGLIGGTLAGSFLSAATGGRLALRSFSSAPETGRYLAGGSLMGFGGVLAGGCTIGAGLSGIAVLSVTAGLALAAIAAGAFATHAVLSSSVVPEVVPA